MIFDLHSTLADQGDSADWLTAAEKACGITAVNRDDVLLSLDSIVETARVEDPEHLRDLSIPAHREIFGRLLADFTTEPLTSALYDSITAGWFVYEDSIPVLDALREQGIKTAVLSNIAIDATELLDRLGILDHVDAVVVSHEIGVVKPNATAFYHTADALELPVESLLMVGDNAHDDGGAARVGIRTLILPRTRGPVHGLATVLGVVAGAQTLRN